MGYGGKAEQAASLGDVDFQPVYLDKETACVAQYSDTVWSTNPNTNLTPPRDVRIRVYDPGGQWTVADYLEEFVVDQESKRRFAEVIHPDILRVPEIRAESEWQLEGATNRPERDCMLPIHPDFMKSLYSAWIDSRGLHKCEQYIQIHDRHYDPTHPEDGLPVHEPPQLSEKATKTLEEAMSTAVWLQSESGVLDREQVNRMLRTAYSITDQEFGVDDAVSAGKGYEFPPDMIERDMASLLDNGGNLIELAKKNFERLAPRRLNIERIRQSLSRTGVNGAKPVENLSEAEKVDFIRLCRLAQDGMKLPTAEGFSPNTKPRKMRELYKEVHQCVNRSLHGLWSDFLVLVLPTLYLIHLGLCHFTPIGWTTKTGKHEGRQLFDAKDNRGGHPLNPEDKKEFTNNIRYEWGKIENADLELFCKQILQFEDDMQDELGSDFHIGEVNLFKFDLSRAFHLLSFHPDSVPLLACELHQATWPEFTPQILQWLALLGVTVLSNSTRSWSLLYVTGSFGLILLPFVFCVVTRCFLILVKMAIRGRACSYVDDTMAVTLSRYLHHDLASVCEVAESLLGPTAIEWKKFYYGRVMVALGWQIDLNTRRVTLSYRNFLKVVYGFYSVDLSTKLKVRILNKLASWSSRYTQILRALQPCTVSLYSQIAGMRNMEATMTLHEDTRTAILLWRASLLLLYLFEDVYALPLDRFRCRKVSYDVEYDASLLGLGYLIYILFDGQRGRLVGCGQVRFPFDCRRDSSFQNSCEFLALLLGILTLAQMGVRNESVRLSGDSRTSLTWGVDGHFKGKLSQRSALVYILASLLFDNVATESVHIPGIENVVCDDLSRFKVTTAELGIDPTLHTDLSRSSPLHQILTLVDPTLPSPFASAESFRDFWTEARLLLSQIAQEDSLLL